jgi:hypothetical protein
MTDDQRKRKAENSARYHRENPYRYLKKNYGITEQHYEDMLRAQNGVCAMCGQEEVSKIRGKTIRLSVDHNHGTGAIRSLLCRVCNLVERPDDIEFLKSRIRYLECFTAPALPANWN